MKKIALIAVTLTTIVPGALGADCYTPYCPRGFYAGGALGMQAITARYVISCGNHRNKASASGKSVIGGLFAGYGDCLSSLYIGAEVSANSCSSAVNFAQTAYVKHQLTNKANAAVKLRVGYVLSQANILPGMVFAAVGGDYSRWHAVLQHNHLGTRERKKIHGIYLSVGSGLEHALTANTFVKYEYTFVKGPKFKEYHRPLSYKTNANQHRFMAGLGYRF